MSCYQMALTMNGQSQNRKRQYMPVVVLLLVMWTMMLTGAAARPNLDSQFSKQNDGAQLFVDEWLLTNGQNLIQELKKYQHKQPNYLSKWPSLRDLVLTVDYDDDLTGGLAENDEILNYKLYERLRQLAPPPENGGNPALAIHGDNGDNSIGVPLKLTSNQNAYKKHNAKKNAQFMSPCHFKICNMGRKRDARRMFSNNY